MHLYTIISNILKRYPKSLVIIAIILYLSLANISGNNIPDITNLDKVAHFCMYAGFCSVLWFEYHTSHTSINKVRIILGAIIAPILFSGAIEIAQTLLTENRSADWYDLLFNTLGTLFAAALGVFVIRPMATKIKTYKKG